MSDDISRAVLARMQGRWLVLWWSGSQLEDEIRQVGTEAVELGLMPPADGTWIWEGTYVVVQTGFNPSWELTDPRGKFRAPTDQEQIAIDAGSSPWKHPG
jgi:hypothetical protein